MQNQNSNKKYEILEWRDGLTGFRHTISGDVKIIKDFSIPQLRSIRRIWIYLPHGYQGSHDRYPVLYMHDGQSVFDIQTNAAQEELLVDETLEKLVMEGRTKGAIVVAIDSNHNRRVEYNPVPVYSSAPDSKTDLYAEFIVKTLKPYIDENFRTMPDREYTGIAGISAGAICSLYIGLKYQEVFSKIGAFSFTMLQTIANMPDNLKEVLTKRKDMRIYMDIGGQEAAGLPQEMKAYFVADLVAEISNFYKLLRERGFTNAELKLIIDDKGEHKIAAAARRFSAAFLWLFDNLGVF